MAEVLKSGRKAAQAGKATSLLVFLHGYGADGSDLLSLADVLGPHLPGTEFLAPDAPLAVPGAPFGRQWFAIPRYDGSSEAMAAADLARSSALLADWLEEKAAGLGLPLSACAFLGFSQGAMMALQVAPRLGMAMAGVVAISGRLMQPERLAVEAVSKPPVLLVHGDQDEVVPFSSLAQAGEALTGAGFATYAHVMKGTGHGIAQDGLQVALGFLHEVLPG